MSKRRVILEIDGCMLFDAVQKVGQEAAGSRMLGLMLDIACGELGFLDSLGPACYGITVHEENATRDSDG